MITQAIGDVLADTDPSGVLWKRGGATVHGHSGALKRDQASGGVEGMLGEGQRVTLISTGVSID